MATSELAIRFTENKYATRSEVSKELKMSLIDNIWSNILAYRSTFNHYLTIKSIEKNQLYLCQCPSVSALSNSTDVKLFRTMKESSQLNATTGDLSYFEDKCLILSLKEIAKEKDLDVSEGFLRSLIHGEVRELSKENQILAHYLAALNFIKNKYASAVDEDFLAGIYSKLTGNEELTSFYREQEDRNRENRVIIDRVYTCAPVALINGMMNSLFDFISNSTLSAACKAAIAYYYIVYIRPFNDYSDEIAILIAKAILAHNDFGEVGALLPIESILSQDQEEIAKLFVEVQKASDTTYIVNYMLKLFANKCDEMLDIIANAKADSMKRDFYRVEPEKQAMEAPKDFQEARYEQPTLFEQPMAEEEKKEEPVYLVKEPELPPVKQEEVKPVPAVKEVVEEPVKEITPEHLAEEQIAVAYVPPALDERQASRLAQHLLELDPSLRKHEAHFYARHCTLGKKYTIAQYKKSIGCVYETARTSMDHLVELGYYRKEMVKNKFVYSPIARKD